MLPITIPMSAWVIVIPSVREHRCFSGFWNRISTFLKC